MNMVEFDELNELNWFEYRSVYKLTRNHRRTIFYPRWGEEGNGKLPSPVNRINREISNSVPPVVLLARPPTFDNNIAPPPPPGAVAAAVR